MERLTPGWISFTNESIEPVEVTQVISKDFVYGIYKFMLLPNKGMLDLNKYFNEKEDYVKKGYRFDEDIMEVFVERHRAWTKK